MARIDVTPPSAALHVGQQTHFSATARDANGNALSIAIAWSTSSPTKATIASDGTLTATDTGAVTITASVAAISGTATVAITLIPVSTVTIAAPATVLRVGQQMQLSASLRDSGGTALIGRRVSWSSSAPAVAVVDTTGKLSAVASGSVAITATSEGRSATVALTINPPAPVQTISVSVRSDLIVAGATTEQATVVLQSAEGDTLAGRTVTWSSSNPAVATVDASGNISARTAGTTQLSASAEGKTASVSIVVESRTKYERVAGERFWFLDNSDSRMPVWDPVRGGEVPQATDRRQQIVIDENFTVPAGKTVVWDNKIVWLRPNGQNDVTVYGTLVIRNSLLLWDQTQHYQSSLRIKAGGTLQGDNSYFFESNQYTANLVYDDGATVRLDHFQGHPWTGMTGHVDYRSVNASTMDMTLFGVVGGTISVADAHDVWLELFPAPGTYDFSMPRTQAWQTSRLPQIWPSVAPEITNSWIQRVDVSLNTGVKVTLRDGVDGMGVGWDINNTTPGALCEIHGLGAPAADPFNDPGTLYQDKTWDLPCNNSSLRLVNTRLMNAWPNANANAHLKVFDSNLVDPRNQSYGSAPTTFEIYNSTVWRPAVIGGGWMYLENVTVVQDLQVNGAGSMAWGYNVRGANGVPLHVSEEAGGRFILLTRAGIPW